VDSDAFSAFPVYKTPAYELRVYYCPSDTPGGCRSSKMAPWRQIGRCDGGGANCTSSPIKLQTPRSVTLYFLPLIYEKARGRLMTPLKNVKVLPVTWTNTGQRCPEQQPGPAVGEDHRVEFSWNGNGVINVNGTLTPPDPANLTGNFQHWDFIGHDNRTGADLHCTGGLLPGRRAAPGRPVR
jgi:hypothetical protein